MALFFLIVIRYFPAPLLCAKIPSAILVSSAIRARVVGEVEEGERSRMQKDERRNIKSKKVHYNYMQFSIFQVRCESTVRYFNIS